jgi:hypothetical protein
MSWLLSFLDRRVNPVLVKEVRQSVRGRFFRTAFLFALAIAWITTLLVLQEIQGSRDQANGGRVLFLWLHGIFVLTSFIIVPQLANRGMAAEQEENTFDALITSGLAPAKIVAGKIMAALVIQLLFLCAFLPFLSMGFTLYGLDIVISFVLLLFTTAGGFGLALVGIQAACLAKTRASSNLIQGLFTLGIVTCSMSWLGFSTGMTLEIGALGLTGWEFFFAVILSLLAWFLFLYWVFAYTVSTITHPEENSSARLRSAAILLSIGMLAGATTQLYFEPDAEGLNAWLVWILLLTAFFHLPSFTSKDSLGRRASADLSLKKWNRPGMGFFLKGGGRGTALFFLCLALPLLLFVFFPSLEARDIKNGALAPIATLLIILAVTGLPAALAASPKASPQKQKIWRFLILFSIPLLSLLAVLTGLLMGEVDAEHPLNAIGFIFGAFDPIHDEPSLSSGGVIFFGLFAIVGFLVGLKRIVRALQETRSTKRAIREGMRPSSE